MKILVNLMFHTDFAVTDLATIIGEPDKYRTSFGRSFSTSSGVATSSVDMS